MIHGNYTKSGKPILANDPHLGNQVPSLWYFTRFENTNENDPDFKFAFGANMPGLLGLPSGRNDRIAWGVSALFTDTSDVYE